MPGKPSNRLKQIAIAGLLAIWGGLGVPSNLAADDGPPRFDGTIGQFTLIKPLRPAPQIPLTDEKGRTVTLGAFKGKVVLVNFWATWCGPCVREMPALDALQAKFGREKFVIVAVSLDRLGFKQITPFLERIRVARLTVLLDKNRALYRKVGGQGLPTTLLLDHEGKVRGYLEGPAEWDSKEAVALVRYYLDAAHPVKKAEAGAAKR
ncbi:MAG: TlpA family protein disulfide reductase [Alphaproteobacteria bacterium]|nr:TlpA family protein disulfide reductase [Alphaproteobacteria bacterium]